MHNHEFINYYQPVIDIQNGTLLGFETLVRWEKQNRILNPGDFLQEINNFELARALDEFVFEKIRADRKKMEEYGATSNIFVSINISRQTFEYMVKESGDAHIRISCGEKEYIVIELLEDIVMRKNIAEKIRELHDQGVHFAIDDFGTGNSNIAFIRSFTNMKIKIDRAFVPLDVNNKKERVMIEAFVQMFIDQGVKLIVEGVETREQYLYLKSLGVAAVQGFYFSKPLPLHAAIRFMREEEYRSKL
jgi:EAL domain-containing protein (putative c-di-GMP-specific phosphodiesterase class I)